VAGWRNQTPQVDRQAAVDVPGCDCRYCHSHACSWSLEPTPHGGPLVRLDEPCRFQEVKETGSRSIWNR
jgi:hypothetical protein